jgi:hypothetical protein
MIFVIRGSSGYKPAFVSQKNADASSRIFHRLIQIYDVSV